jgi:hypothetical protein
MMEQSDDQSKPPRKPKKAKKTIKKPKRHSKPVPASKKTKNDPLEALSAFFAVTEDPSTRKYRADISTMQNVLKEYMSSFIIIGYTVDGTPVQETHASNMRDMDALSTGLQKYICDTMTRQNFPPEGPGSID